MNERIDKLFGQALDKAVPETWTTLDADQLNRFKAKFAELIVGECVDKIGENFVGAVGTHASAHNSAVLKCQKIIKQHFGVGE